MLELDPQGRVVVLTGNPALGRLGQDGCESESALSWQSSVCFIFVFCFFFLNKSIMYNNLSL